THPDCATIVNLAAKFCLEESVITTWFKNQRVRWRKEQREQLQPQPNGPAEETTSVKEEEETPVSKSVKDTHMTSPGTSDESYYDPQELSGMEKPGGAGALDSSGDSQPFDILEIALGDSNPPWASMPYEIDEFVKLYDLSGDEDPNMLDQYLFP
uniref:Homeobox domain-containing protein n=1 Tax=Otolemur garnettii TaxID=30611 RepID=H0Y2C9_OTOGA